MAVNLNYVAFVLSPRCWLLCCLKSFLGIAKLPLAGQTWKLEGLVVGRFSGQARPAPPLRCRSRRRCHHGRHNGRRRRRPGHHPRQ